MEDNLFEPVHSDTPTIEEGKNYFEELVGEGRKFKTPEDLAKGKYLADQTVNVLKAKLDELTSELKTRTSLDAFKTELKELYGNRGEPPPRVPEPDAFNTDKLDASTLEQTLDQLLQKREAQRSFETNRERIKRVLVDKLGDQAQSVVNRKAQSLGISLAEFQAMAIKSPIAFFQLLGVSEEPHVGSGVPLPQSSYNNTTTPPANVKGRSYYERLKKSDPTSYFDQKTTVEMMKSMEALGKEKFEAS